MYGDIFNLLIWPISQNSIVMRAALSKEVGYVKLTVLLFSACTEYSRRTTARSDLDRVILDVKRRIVGSQGRGGGGGRAN